MKVAFHEDELRGMVKPQFLQLDILKISLIV